MPVTELSYLLQAALSLPRPSAAECAVERYTGAAPSVVNAITAAWVIEAAQHCQFHSEEHSPWVSPDSSLQDEHGERFLSFGYLRYPVQVFPEPEQMKQELRWRLAAWPESLSGVATVDDFAEALAATIFSDLECYRQALTEWFHVGRPTCLGDLCRKDRARAAAFVKARRAQEKRVANVESRLAFLKAKEAPPHMLQCMTATLFHEHEVLEEIRQAVSLCR